MSRLEEFDDVQLDVEFTQAGTRSNLTSNENIAISLGKISKWYEALVPTGGSSGQFLAWNSDGTAKWVANPNTDTKVTSTLLAQSTAAATYLPTFVSAAGNSGVNIMNSFSFRHTVGTTSAVGNSRIVLGNATASGTANNEEGQIILYSSSTSYHTIKGSATASTVTHSLPTTGGTILNTGTTSFTQTLSSGTKIGSIKINGTSQDIYAPTNTNTTYTLTQDATDGHKITLTPSSGTAQTVTIPDNNTTYTLSGVYGSSSNTWVTTLTPSSGTATTSTVPTASTSVYGITKLSSATNSTSTALAATPSAVKSAYDLANGKSTVSFSASLTSGTKIGTITIDGTGTDIYCETNTNTDTKVTDTVGTANTYYPAGGTSTSTATGTQVFDTSLKFIGTTGTTSVVGKAQLVLGNSTASGTANNKQGSIVLYGSTAYAHTIQGAPTAARTLTLPNKTGTVAVTSDIPTVNDAALTLKGAGTTVTTFTANASSAKSLDIVAGSNVTVTADATNAKISIASSHPTITKSTDTTSTASPAHGGTFTTVDSVTRDGNGHVTKINTKTVTLPADSNTDTKVNVTLATTSKAYLLGTSTTPTSSAQAVTSVADTGVYLGAEAGSLVASSIYGSGAEDESTIPSSGYHIYDCRKVNVTPVAGDKSAIFYFHQTDTPDTAKWWSILHMRGWTGTAFNTWEIAGPAHMSDQRTTPLYVRSSNGSTTWGSWRKIYDTSNPPTASEVGALASTTKYAGSSSAGGAATSANKLNTDAGGTYLPVYFSSGVPTAVTVKNNIAKGTIGWTNGAAANAALVTVNSIAYWDGAFIGTSSNLTYCNRGAFGTIVTKSATDYSKVSITRNLTSGTKVGTITIDGTATDLYCQTNTNTTYSAGTGLSLSGTTFNHSNSVTAETTFNKSRFKYDAQGHITESSYYVHTAEGTGGSAGWIKIATMTHTKTYNNTPIMLTISQRGNSLPYRILIRFTNVNSTDPDLDIFQLMSDTITAARAYIIKSATSTWDLYIFKLDVWESLVVTEFDVGASFTNKMTWSWTDVQTADSAITGGTEATKKVYSTTDHTHSYLPLSGGTMTGDITFASISGNTYPISSKGIKWGGGTDAIDMYYNLRESDAGELIINMRDDSNVRISFAYNGTVKSYIDTNGTYNGNASKTGIRWNAVSQGQKWSRLYYSEAAVNIEGSNGILSISCTRGNVVVNAVFLVFVSHLGSNASHIIELASTNYSTIRCRVVSNSGGSYYFEIYDTASNIASGTSQTWHCCFVTLTDATLTTYTTFTDGSTIPSNFTAANDFTTTVGKASAAIKDISRSGTTFTATRQDGTTFTFTQQDNNTTYSANNGVGLSGTTFYNSGVRAVSTGSANGTISVNTNGTSGDVPVKGLGTAAYTESSDYIPTSAIDITNKTDIGLDSAKNGFGYVNNVTKADWNYQQTNGVLIRQVWSNLWKLELYGDYCTGHLSVRGKNNGTWQNWLRILDEGNYTTFAYSSTASRAANTVLAAPNGSAGAATFRKLVAADLPSHTHSYLPLSGGTMTGTITHPANTVAINLRADGASTWQNTIMTQNAGDEAVVFANANARTSWMFVNGEDSIAHPERNRWQSLTPALQIKGGCVAIGKLIPNGTTPTTRLDIAGDTALTGDIQLKTSGSSSDDSGDIVWYYGNGKEKMRLWSNNTYTAKSGPNFRVYKSDETLLFNGTLSLSDHTHNYAGSSSAGGAATSANKLNTDAGSTSIPVYFSGGVPVQCTTPNAYQTNTTTNADYRVLFSTNANDTTQSGTTRKNINLQYNPSTATLKIGDYVSSSTATKNGKLVFGNSLNVYTHTINTNTDKLSNVSLTLNSTDGIMGTDALCYKGYESANLSSDTVPGSLADISSLSNAVSFSGYLARFSYFTVLLCVGTDVTARTTVQVSAIAGYQSYQLIWGGAPNHSGGNLSITSGLVNITESSGTITLNFGKCASYWQFSSSSSTPTKGTTPNIHVLKVYGHSIRSNGYH